MTGLCLVERRSDGALFIQQADEQVRISAELLDQIDPTNFYVNIAGRTFTIRGVNRTVVYKLSDYDLLTHTWLGTRQEVVPESQNGSSEPVVGKRSRRIRSSRRTL